MSDEPFEVVDSSGLTDADWAEINKLKKAYETGGQKALSKAFDDLNKDPIAYVRVIGAFYPNEVRESIKDAMPIRLPVKSAMRAKNSNGDLIVASLGPNSKANSRLACAISRSGA